MAAARHAEPIFFETPEAFRDWLARHAATETVLIVGFMKRSTGKPSMTWPQSVDEALCVGWIDGIRKGIDGERYFIRFTPRKRGSHWSAVNIRRVGELQAEGRMQPAGLAAFALRTAARSAKASYEQAAMPALEPAHVKTFKRDRVAWKFYEAQPPSYRRRVNWWVISAKQEATRVKRLTALIAACAGGRRL
jgi:uncharacterized protein YdeI (YjbR/CyaY-like superfamily)